MPELATPTIDDIRAAALRIERYAVRTPLLESGALNAVLGARILIKPEVLQRTGSFKFRGAYNRLAAMSGAERAAGVVAFSSGNHAQGVAAAARMFGVDAVIAMPLDTPAIKVRNVEADGAKTIRYDRFRDDRMALVQPYADAGRTLVPPYEDPFIIAGQGTIGLEIVAQTEEIGATPDIVIAPCGGGGLISGVSIAVKAALPDAQVWGAEPQGFDDTRRSLEAGRRVSNATGQTSICDAILTNEPGVMTFEINRKNLNGVAVVGDSEVEAAMRTAADYYKLVVEPGGIVAFAGILSGKLDIAGKTVVVVLSGGNVDPELYSRVIGIG
jgi:threonine dehydratase